ncbi:hypothetical protein V6N13_028289 [Hibiscus sabdariffa]
MDWKKLLFGGGNEQTLDFFPPVVCEDSFTIDPPSEVFNEGFGDWRHAFVGQFIGAAPNFVALKKIVDSLWGKDSLAKVSLAGPNLYVFSFVNVSARDWVLENGPWHIQHKPLVLRKWEPNLPKLDFDLACMPVWIQLFNVPLELFSRRGLSYIASGIGKPLYMDSVTASRERLEFAKVCVEVAAGARIPRVIPVKMNDQSIVAVRVKIPWMPASCSHCKLFGHSDKLCSAVQEGVANQNPIWKAKPIVSNGEVDSSGVHANVVCGESSTIGEDVSNALVDEMGELALLGLPMLLWEMVLSQLVEMKAREIGKVKANVPGATGQGGVSFSQ